MRIVPSMTQARPAGRCLHRRGHGPVLLSTSLRFPSPRCGGAEDPRSVPEHPGSQKAGSHRIYSSPVGYMESILKSLRFSIIWEWTRLNASSSSEPHWFRASARVIRSCAESQGRQIHTEHPIAPEIHHGITESRQRLAVHLRFCVKLANDSRL